MRLRDYGITIAAAAAAIFSLVDGRSLAKLRNATNLQLELEEHADAHWDGSARLTFKTASGDQSPNYLLSPLLHRRQQSGSDPEWLRILPLGASIVRELTSRPEDGFRKPLRDRLRFLNFKVNMVGSQ